MQADPQRAEAEEDNERAAEDVAYRDANGGADGDEVEEVANGVEDLAVNGDK